jgi:signal transduction histidine kinase/CheY-like chemotaxis protein
MFGRTDNQRYLFWLALGTAVMALAMASLLVSVLAQRRTMDQSSAVQSDSLTALVFQFEREFLRARQLLAATVASPQAPDGDALRSRFGILQSRLTVLRSSPNLSLLASRDEFSKLIPRLEHLVSEVDKALTAHATDREALAHALGGLNTLEPDVQALSLAAHSEVARLVESQSNTMRRQNALIAWLAVAQLALLLIASMALVLRQKRLQAERLALEQLTHALRDAKLRAETASRAKSQFLAHMGQGLRTPCNGLIGMLALLKGTSPTPQQADFIDTAQGCASHLLALLNDVLDLSALETGNITLKPTAFALTRLVRDVNALMQPLANDKGLVFHTKVPDEPLPMVMADETRIKQIVFNLVGNAIEFTEAGQVVLTVSEGPRTAHKMALVFEIQDSGMGIDGSALQRLSQPFYQADVGSSPRLAGTGLDLDLSRSLARMMDGEITVRSTWGVGSTFTVTLHLPIVEGSLGEAENAPRSAPVGASMAVVPAPAAALTGQPAPTHAGQTPPAHTLRVLVVEDHPINQKLVGVLLGRMGCHISYCENGQLAVDLVQRESFDLILMDVNMPVLDGVAATRQIRSLPTPAARTPIVVLTADAMNEASAQAMAAGANDFISKPLKVEQLRAVILKHTTAAV